MTLARPSFSTIISSERCASNTELISIARYDTPEALSQVLEIGMEESFRQTLDHLEALLFKKG